MKQKPLLVFRAALESDIPGMQIVRNAVTENRLSDPSVIRDSDYLPFIDSNGRGWVCTVNETVVGFAFVDAVHRNVWALFVHPEFENMGIGKTLHQLMLDWYFFNHTGTLWLSTAPQTRAERFYELLGWERTGIHGKEIKFELSVENWNATRNRVRPDLPNGD